MLSRKLLALFKLKLLNNNYSMKTKVQSEKQLSPSKEIK